MVAGSEGVGDFVLEVAVKEHLDEAGFSDVWVREKYVFLQVK